MSVEGVKPEKVVGVAAEIISIAKDNPDARIAGEYAAKSLAIASKAVHTALLPLAAINYGAEKARQYFESKFEKQITDRLREVPQEHIVEPKASIAGPALQGLAFSHDEEDLRDLYLALLQTAMDGRVREYAHPAFVEIIRQISAAEIQLLSLVLTRAPDHLTIAQLREKLPEGNTFSNVLNHVCPIVIRPGNAPLLDERRGEYIDNWIRLGLVNVNYSRRSTGDNAYGWVESRPEYKRFEAELPAGSKIHVVEGLIEATQFGAAFAAAVGMFESANAQSGLGAY